MEPQAIIYLPYLGTGLAGEARNGVSLWIIFQDVNGSQEKESGQGSPILGATAAGEGTEAPSDNAVLTDDRNHDGGTSSNSQVEGQQEEPIPGSTKDHWALSGLPGKPQPRHKFTEFQLQELELIFERNHYPSAEV
ncbi:homeobox protein aristaless-like, partial [Microtus ochrogaster]|uniref:Homeobox protein aristaless-like n=1 Tax=Microtus ochrogaster TaxID=79684 RepID=A0ABM0LT00_MICOH